MNYQRIYDQIVQRGQLREKEIDVYYEQHHIIPRCIGGDDKKENLVDLTGREHFICHWLLVRIYPDNRKLIYAFWMMCCIKSRRQSRYKPSSRTYQESREQFSIIHSEEHSNREVSLETRRKIGLKSKNRVYSKERNRKISEKLTGRICSEEHKQNIRKSKTGKKNGPQTEEQRQRKLNTIRTCKHCSNEVEHRLFISHVNKCKKL